VPMIMHDARLLHRWRIGEGTVLTAALNIFGYPIAALYHATMKVRNSHYDDVGGQEVRGVKVVSVGNLVVGGTGKTPLSAWIVRVLKDGGLRPAIVSRGYGSDELILHNKWNPHIPVIATPDRLEAARSAREGGADTVVLDDGFQHRKIARDLDIVLLSAEDSFPGRLLPVGPYRESAESLRRADAIVVTRRSAPKKVAEAIVAQVKVIVPEALTAVVHLAPAEWRNLKGSVVPSPEGEVLAIAAIARPLEFLRGIRSLVDSEVELMSFSDHHEYTSDDIVKIARIVGERTIVVTEKDAVKLAQYNRVLGDVRVLVEEVRWESGKKEVEGKFKELMV